MKKKSLLILGPVSAHKAESASVLNSLDFLRQSYHIDYVDSLKIMRPISNERYYGLWRNYIRNCMQKYDGFLGFSFGGVILQQCFAEFSQTNQPIILFSTPSFADIDLSLKLGRVIELCQINQLEKALTCLYQNVFLSGHFVVKKDQNLDQAAAIKRLVFGLDRVLKTDSRPILMQHHVDHLHFIGQASQLVNQKNVIEPNKGCLKVVPKAGMRVLEDNPKFCKLAILERLSGAK